MFGQFWTIDATEREGIHVLTLIDLASRLVVGVEAQERLFSASETRIFLERTIKEAGPFKMLHSNCDAALLSNDVVDFLQQQGIEQSVATGEYKAHGNQVHECFHKQLWGTLDCWRTNEEGLIFWSTLEYQQKRKLVLETIRIINNSLSSVFCQAPTFVHASKVAWPVKTDEILIAQKDSAFGKLIMQYSYYAIERNIAQILSEFAATYDLKITPTVIPEILLPVPVRHEIYNVPCL